MVGEEPFHVGIPILGLFADDFPDVSLGIHSSGKKKILIMKLMVISYVTSRDTLETAVNLSCLVRFVCLLCKSAFCGNLRINEVVYLQLHVFV